MNKIIIAEEGDTRPLKMQFTPALEKLNEEKPSLLIQRQNVLDKIDNKSQKKQIYLH